MKDTASLDLLHLPHKDALGVLYRLLLLEEVEGALALVRTCMEVVQATKKGSPGPLEDMFDSWYASLERGAPDFSVYDSQRYLADTFACWAIYSRKYLLLLQKPSALHPHGIARDIGDAGTVVDLGCGLGFSTAGLSQLFSAAAVVGTNVPDSLQTRVAKRVADPSGTGQPAFRVVSELSEVRGPVSLAFASEYFEHFADPIGHLRDVIREIDPASFLIANTFGSDSIGHFNTYLVNGKAVAGGQTSRAFGKELRARGYRKVKTCLWNSRPTYWRRA